MDALDVVKKEIKKERKARYAREMEDHRNRMQDVAMRNHPKFPHIRRARIPIDGGGPVSKLPKTPSEKVDIRDLTWEDRERVLRLLFAKINSVQGILGGRQQSQKPSTAAVPNEEDDAARVFTTQSASVDSR